MEVKEGRKGGRRAGNRKVGGAGKRWEGRDELVQETMVALWFMFKLFFIKSNLRFYLSSLSFFSFSFFISVL